MIILEGPDNSGKSTLAARIKRDLKIPVIHSQKPSEDWTSRMVYEHCLKQLAPRMELSILDRVTAISEAIYGPICRGESALGNYQAEALLDLWQRPYAIIYCRPSDETILDNKGREQMPGVLENHKKIIEAYDRVMDDISIFSSCYVMKYDWQVRTNYQTVLNWIATIQRSHLSFIQSAAFMSKPQ